MSYATTIANLRLYLKDQGGDHGIIQQQVFVTWCPWLRYALLALHKQSCLLSAVLYTTVYNPAVCFCLHDHVHSPSHQYAFNNLSIKTMSWRAAT